VRGREGGGTHSDPIIIIITILTILIIVVIIIVILIILTTSNSSSSGDHSPAYAARSACTALASAWAAHQPRQLRVTRHSSCLGRTAARAAAPRRASCNRRAAATATPEVPPSAHAHAHAHAHASLCLHSPRQGGDTGAGGDNGSAKM
jgi:hypothetical protein